MRRTWILILFGWSLAGCSTGPSPVLQGISIAGDSVVLLGKTSQLSVLTRTAAATSFDVTAQATLTSSNTAVATISSTGVVTAVTAGTTTIAASYQGQSAQVVVQVPPPAAVSLHLGPIGTFSDIGQTQQLMLTAVFNDGTSRDVTTLAQWSPLVSDFAVIVSPGGLLTTRGFGTGTVMASFDGLQVSATVTVTLAGTFMGSGVVRLPATVAGPGAGVSGVFVIGTSPRAGTLISNTDAGGNYAVGFLMPGVVLTLSKSGFETTTLTVAGPDLDAVIQPVTRITAGQTVNITMAPTDTSYDPSPDFHCGNCRLIRVVAPATGTLHLDLTWTGPGATVAIWSNGTFVGAPTTPQRVTADLPVPAGEAVLYVQSPPGVFVPLTLATSFATSAPLVTWSVRSSDNSRKTKTTVKLPGADRRVF